MLYNLIVGTLMTIMLWLAIRGIIWQKNIRSRNGADCSSTL